MFRQSTFFICLALSHLVLGKDTCSCSPLVYRWKIDFTSSCPPIGLNVGPDKGITNIDCDVVGEDGTVDLEPIQIKSYQLSELDMNLQVFKSEAAQNLSLTNGDSVEFISETSSNPAFYSGGLQAIFDAENELGQSIRLTWILVFSNICEIEPFLPGQSLGWLSISDDFDKASDSTCLISSYSPTKIPSRSPSKLPTKRPSNLPTRIPSRSPTVSPSKSPHILTVGSPWTSSPTMQSMAIPSVSTMPSSLTPKPSAVDAPAVSQLPTTILISKSSKGKKSNKSGKVSMKSKKSKSGKSSKKQTSFKAILIESYVPDSRV